jgi:DNA-binding transcriptional ArsR family regulator
LHDFLHRQTSNAISVRASELIQNQFGAGRTDLLVQKISRLVTLDMVAAANLVEIAALVGDTARATMLAALMDGRSLTGRELAFLARISPSTASEHLAKLVTARLVAMTQKRRFNYYRIASPLVAGMLENMKTVAAIEVPARYQRPSAQDSALRFARTCYDHLAGYVGIAITDALRQKGHIVLDADGGELTPSGHDLLTRFGAALSQPRGHRIFCRPCLDWSERRYHLAGHVGAEICRQCLELGWLKREHGSRALKLTPAGRTGLAEVFAVELAEDQSQGKLPPDFAAVSSTLAHTLP